MFAPAAMPSYAIVAIVWGLLLSTGPATGFWIGRAFLVLLIPVGFTFALVPVLRRRQLAAAATAVECIALMAVMSFSFVMLSYEVARLGMPYADATFDRMDHALLPGFDWVGSVSAFAATGWPLRIANFAYDSLWWQNIVLIVLLCATGHSARCWRYSLAWAFSLALALLVFAALPAVGAYGFHHVPHRLVSGIGSSAAWRAPILLEHLRAVPLITVDPRDMVGIVQFPSFHTASACLFCWGMWVVRWARPPAIALNVCVVCASVPIGGHYLVDIPAGIVTAMLGVAAATMWRTPQAAARGFGDAARRPIEAPLMAGL